MNKVSKNFEKGVIGGLVASVAQIGAYMTMKTIADLIPVQYSGETVVALTGIYAAILAGVYNMVRHMSIKKEVANASPKVQ